MLRYSKTPYGIGAEQSKIPNGVRSMATAPTASNAPVRIFEPDGTAHEALYHRGSWHMVERVYDPFSGKTRLSMTNETVNQPVG
jgi:hypothetical protein